MNNGITDGIANRETLRKILAATPDLPPNRAVRAALLELISANAIQPIPYTYTLAYWVAGGANALPVAAANVPALLNIQADNDFLVISQTYSANTANAAMTAATRVIPNVSVILTETGSGYQMMDQAVPIPAMFGTGELPFVLPQPRLLPARAAIQSLATNFDAAVGYNVLMHFHGVKLVKR